MKKYSCLIILYGNIMLLSGCSTWSGAFGF
ncbi:PBP1b-binding outer membrane lipoprotein LpoB [Acinetobacter guillouiae]|nr:PBP1b-binding outer membrane lipoprotein LpoB [Acinetobacter guillouiae]